MFGDNSAPLPPVTLTDPVPLTVNGKPAMEVTATVSRTYCSDGRSGVVHAIALPGNRGQPVVFVVGAEQGMPGAVSDADMQKMLMSVRPRRTHSNPMRSRKCRWHLVLKAARY
jgi:hypothetical protein